MVVAVGGEYFWSCHFMLTVNHCTHSLYFTSKKGHLANCTEVWGWWNGWRSTGCTNRTHQKRFMSFQDLGGKPFSISSSGSISNKNLLCPSASCARQRSALELFGIQTMKGARCGVRETWQEKSPLKTSCLANNTDFPFYYSHNRKAEAVFTKLLAWETFVNCKLWKSQT